MRYSKILALLIVGILYYFMVTEYEIGLVCPVNYFLHLKCPGCGVTHLIVSLINRDIGAAFIANPFIFVATPYYLVLHIFYRRTSIYNKGCILLLLSCILFGVLRNIV